jgi:signal peptidase II
MSLPGVLRSACLFFPLLLGVTADQILKSIARELLDAGLRVSYWHGLIQLQLIENRGGFLGYLNLIPEQPRFWLLTVGVGVMLLAAAVWLLRSNGLSSLQRIVAALIIAGGVSNLLDRLCHAGGVTDFISIGIGPLRTGIFNLADVYILAGAFYLGFFFSKRQRPGHQTIP